MIEVNDIVTLENQNNYWILDETDYEGDKYVYTERVLEDETETGEFYFFRCSKHLDGEHLTPVIDKELCNDLLEEFEDMFIDVLLSGELDSQ